MKIDELERLHEAATKALWEANGLPRPRAEPMNWVDIYGPNVKLLATMYIDSDGDNRYADGELIAAARNALPKLLAVAKAAREMRDTISTNGDSAANDESQTVDAIISKSTLKKLREPLAEMEAK